MDDALHRALSSLPEPTRRLRRRRLEQIVPATAASAAWAREAASDAAAHRGALAARLHREGMAPTAVAPVFALFRALAERQLGMRAYDVQLLGAYAMLRGYLAEMATGEGKTLAAAFTTGVAAMAGWPVHVVTVNDYLARRDAEQLTPFYSALGLTTGLIHHGMSSEAKRAAYARDIVYASNKELAFDYLRDQILRRALPTSLHLRLDRLAGQQSPASRLVMRGLHFAIVDEADSVLIDEARTPLIISESGRSAWEGETELTALALAEQLVADHDFLVDPTTRWVDLTPQGSEKLAQLAAPLGGDWQSGFVRDELVGKALSASLLFHRDEHYLVRDGKVQIIDEYTGRLMPDRFWKDGLHQMIEAKEGCVPTGARDTIARITYQRLFVRYRHLCGMSGTLTEVAKELRAVYRLRIARIPTHRLSRRRSEQTLILADRSAKWRTVVDLTQRLTARGQPVLIGTRTVAASIQASKALTEASIDHALLNAEQDAREAHIIAEAGRLGRVTVATNMAGRGTDIRLDPGVSECGGLAVVLTERHDAGRIDRQLAGRCARQGDPGSLHPILSLEDSLLNPLRQAPLGRVLLRLAGRRRWFALILFRLMQRRAERMHSAVRRALLRIDRHTSSALSFSGRPE
jgi:preprotein translocase subunit SecA